MPTKGSLTFQIKGRHRYAIIDLTYPISGLDGWDDHVLENDAEHENLQDQIDDLVSGTAGVLSFNSRDGIVEPQSGDYTAGQVGADPAGSAAAVQGNLTAHTNNTSDPHGTLAALETFTATKNEYEFDTDDQERIVNGSDIFLGLEVIEDFAAGDIVEVGAHLPLVTGSAGSTELLFELIHDFAGTPTIIATEQIRVGNNTISVDVDVSTIITTPLATATIGLYATAVSGNTTIANDILEAKMISKKAHNFSFKAYAP